MSTVKICQVSSLWEVAFKTRNQRGISQMAIWGKSSPDRKNNWGQRPWDELWVIIIDFIWTLVLYSLLLIFKTILQVGLIFQMWLLKFMEVNTPCTSSLSQHVAKQEFATMSVWLNISVFLCFHIAFYGTKVTKLIGCPQWMSCSAFQSIPLEYHMGSFKL